MRRVPRHVLGPFTPAGKATSDPIQPIPMPLNLTKELSTVTGLTLMNDQTPDIAQVSGLAVYGALDGKQNMQTV